MKTISVLLLRLSIGASLFIHGLVRLPKLASFATATIQSFEDTMLPEFMVIPLGYVIPIAELILGFLILIGFRTVAASVGVGLLMIVLIIGSCFQENWGALPSQFLHIVFAICVIEFYPKSNILSVDRLINKKDN